MDNLDEALVYMHGQIDPRDRLNPRYALLWKQIEAVNKAKADILAAQPMGPNLVPVRELAPDLSRKLLRRRQKPNHPWYRLPRKPVKR